MPEIAALLRKKTPDVATKVSTRRVPDWVIKLASLFNAQAKTGLMLLKVNHWVSNAKAKKLFGWAPMATNEQAILASVNSMVKYGIV
jgi:hypothetical protein